MTALKMLLSPGTPLWIKLVVAALAVAAVIAWWTRGYWEDMHTPDKTSLKRKARPPF